MTPQEVIAEVARVAGAVIKGELFKVIIIDGTPNGVMIRLTVAGHYNVQEHFSEYTISSERLVYEMACRMVTTVLREMINNRAPYNGS